jgi:arginase
MSKTQATLIGVPLDLGAENLGVDIGPDAFRHQQITDKLTGVGFELNDEGNIAVTDRRNLQPGNPRLPYLDEIVRVNEALADKVESSVRSGQKAIVLGGDHSINLGAVSGASVALHGQLGLIYFDAHGDMNTDETSLTANIHGMHLASLMGFGAPALKNVHGEGTKLAKENLLHIGGSDWDQAELDLIARENLTSFSLFDVLTKGLGELIKLIDDLAARVPNIWISLDLDSIDQIYAPGAGMPNAKGLSYREISTLAEYVGQLHNGVNIVGIDVVEYNPLQDEKNKTAELGIELIAKFLGHNYSWYSNYMAHNKP